MKHSFVVTICLVFSLMFSAAQGRLFAQAKNSFEAHSKIDRVMVYQDRALVTRIAKLETVPVGTSEVVFANLPVTLQDDSARAKITDGSGAKVMDVEVRTVLLEKAPELRIRQLQEKLQEQQDDRKRIQNRMKLLQIEIEYLNETHKHYLDSAGAQGRSNDVSGALSRPYVRLKTEDYDSMLRYLTAKYSANSAAQLKDEIELRELDKQIEVTRAELSKISAGQSSSSSKKIVKVIIDAQKAGACTLELAYINFQTRWKPGYDMRVFLDEKKTEFTGYGVVDQSSGEDWAGTLISYSTAQPAVGGFLPELVPLYATTSSKLYTGNDALRQDFAAQNAVNRAVLEGITSSGGAGAAGDGADVESGETDTRTEQKAGSLVFHSQKRSDIPSDGSPHRTVISKNTIPVRFEYACVPRMSPHVFLQAIGSNTMSLPILRGDLNIFMGNDFVGSSNTDTVMPGEDFELTLTADDNIRVSRVLEGKDKDSGGFFSGSLKTSFSFVIKAENFTGKEIILNLYDQIPVSEAEEIEITDVNFSRKPTKQGKNGIVQWQLQMKPRETTKITFSYVVNIPKGKELAFFRTGLTPGQYLENMQKQKMERNKYYESNSEEIEYQQEYKAPAMKKR